MTPVFDLDVETDPLARTVGLRVADAHGNHLALREVAWMSIRIRGGTGC